MTALEGGLALLIGYARVSTTDQDTALQLDALRLAGAERIHEEIESGKKSAKDRPVLNMLLDMLRPADTLLVWRLDRLGRSLIDLVHTAAQLREHGIGLKILEGVGAGIDTGTAEGRMLFNMLATFSEYERELIVGRTRAGITAARARGRKGGRKPKMTASKVRIAVGAMKDPATKIDELCRDLGGISRQTLYRHVAPDGTLRPDGVKVLEGQGEG